MASIFSKKISRRVLRFLFWYSASAKVNWLMIRLAGLKNGRCGYYRKKWGVIQRLPNTLFPLQAALGYDIAQNLFISKKNLLVEGPADLIYLTFFSNLLQNEK